MMLRHPQPPRLQRAGLTLIEVLLSLAIFMMAIVAIGRLVDRGSDTANEARLTTTASRLAQSKLGECEIGYVLVTDGEQTGDFTEEGEEGWSWTVTPELQDDANLYLVTVTVSREVRGRLFTYTLAQMMFDPAMKGSASEVSRGTTAVVGFGMEGSP